MAAVFTLLCTVALAMIAVDGAGSDEDIPNMRLGPEDVKIDTIEVHSLWDPVGVSILNIGESGVGVLILERSDVVPHVNRGDIDWDSILASLPEIENYQAATLPPGESWHTEVETPSIFDTHLILCYSPGGGLGELRITMEYVDDELIWSAMLLSIPSFLIAGIVLAQAVTSEDEVSEQASDEES